MTKTEPSVPSVSYILKKISDDKTLTLFNNIAQSKDYSHTPLRELNLSSKQYYSRISALTSAGPIKKRQGQYRLTALGKIVYNAHIVIGKAVGYFWKMKAIESIQMAGGREIC
jgi:predicted transcriptional regulator